MMTDISAVTKVIIPVAATDPVDIFGYESALFVLSGDVEASSIKVTHGDDKDALADVDLVIAPDTYVVRSDTSGVTKVGYIGARRYVKVAGGTLAAVILQRPAAAPTEYMEAETTEAGAAVASARTASKKVPSNKQPESIPD